MHFSGSILLAAAAISASPSVAQTATIDLPAQDVASAVRQLARQANVQILVSGTDARGRRTNAVKGAMAVPDALDRMLAGTGLAARPTGPQTWVVVSASRAAMPFGLKTASLDVGSLAGEAEVASDDIIVTAQRVAEPLSRVPASVAAFSREKMDVLGIRDFTDIAQQTPGVRIRPEINQIAIRGIASNAGAATTGVYLDETPIQVRTFGEGAASALPLVFDLERVEVLRGPQGTLFGAGSMGGTVRYITSVPPLEGTDVYARGELAFTESGAPIYEAGAAVGTALVDGRLGLRIAATHRRAGGWVDRVDADFNRKLEANANWSEVSTVRAALLFQPNDRITITPAIYWQDRFKNDTDQFWVALSDVGAGRQQQGNPIQLINDDNFLLPSLTASVDLGFAELISNTSWFRRRQTRFYDNSLFNLAGYENFAGELLTADGPNFDRLGIPGYASEGRIENAQNNFTQEVRLQSSDREARVQWLVGAFYTNNRQTNLESIDEPSLEDFFQSLYGLTVEETLGVPLLDGRFSYIGDRFENERQFALFGNLNIAIADRLRAQVGLRWSDIRIDTGGTFQGAYIGPTRTNSGSAREQPFTPRFNLTFQATPETMIYTTVAKGFRSGGVNAPISQRCQQQLTQAGNPIPDLPFASDNLWSYEIGTKGRVGGLRFDASAFRIDWTNIQQRVFLDPCSVTFTLNLGQARSTGFDIALAAQPADGLTLDAAIGYVDSRFSAPVFRGTSATGKPTIAAGDALFQAGFPWQIVIGARYDFLLGNNDAFIRGNWEYSSANWRTRSSLNPDTLSFNPLAVDREATNFVRLRSGVTFGNTEVQLFVDNLFNDQTLLERFQYSRASPFFADNSFRPRTVGITLLHRTR